MFKIFIRSYLKDKKFLFNNFLGFVFAFTTILFIISWITYEKGFDRFYENSSRIYRFTVEIRNGDGVMHFARVQRPWLKEFKEYFPEIEEMVRLAPGRNSALKIAENRFYSEGVFATDSNFFSVFNVRLLKGNPDHVLDAPKCAVINESVAKKYFGNTDPVGQKIEWSHQFGEAFDTYTVTGVMPDFPRNCHFHPEILLSFNDPTQYNQWFYTYLLLKKDAGVASMESKFGLFKKTYLKDKEDGDKEIFHLQNVREIHLNSHKDREIEPNGDSQSVMIMGIVAFILLVVVALNYMNFQIASVMERDSYFNISKTFGAQRKSFIVQLACESFLLIALSSLISLIAYVLTMPLLNSWLHIDILLPHGAIVLIYLSALLLFTCIGIGCSIYPVFLLKVRGMITSLNIFNPGRQRLMNDYSVRKVLVILQFVGSICLIIATSVFIKQNRFLLSNRIGHGQDNIINLVNLPRSAVDKYATFKHELLSHSAILDVTASMEEPAGEVLDAFSYKLEGMPEEDKNKLVYIFPVDHNFNHFYGNKIIAGEDFYNDVVNSKRYVINEAALKFFGYDKPEDIIGKRFKLNFPNEGFFDEGTITGVVSDFHITSLQNHEKPIVLYHQPYFNYCVGIKFDPARISEAMAALSSVWRSTNPDFALQSVFIDDLYFKLYENQIRQSRFLSLLAFVALFISSLGLFSIAVYNIRKRTKEIGIRKVNGAKTGQIVTLLNRTFFKWVVISFIIAAPLSWITMHQWLQNFAYRTDLSWWIFAGTGIFVFGVALITVSLQSWQAAERNPVETLRYE